jgi:hypothetical protein
MPSGSSWPRSRAKHDAQPVLKADDGLRTRDLRLGKPTLYRLSYVRAGRILDGPEV